jgi:hypothetical protein
MRITLKLILFTCLIFTSCNNGGGFLQEYSDYEQFKEIDNIRLTGWFPTSLLKEDSKEIKNISYLNTKCVFGVFNYDNKKLYDSIFTNESYIDSIHYNIFLSQMNVVKDIIPEWFLDKNYWNTERRNMIIFDNCYTYKDSINKKIYYFHPEEESTFINDTIYPGIRNTIR